MAPEMREPTDAALFALIADPSCPAVVSLRKAPLPTRLVFVRPFIDFAEERGFAREETERAMDDAVARIGGDRQRTHDPTLRMRNLIRRARRQPPAAQEEVWFVPTQAPDDPA
jgi:hypothetical protein